LSLVRSRFEGRLGAMIARMLVSMVTVLCVVMVVGALLLLVHQLSVAGILVSHAREIFRSYTRREWRVVAIPVIAAIPINVFLIRAYHGHGQKTVGTVLLVVMLVLALWAIAGVPIAYRISKKQCR
jgi:hypothetical protein